MTYYYIIAIACVVGTATGQILFKFTANLLQATDNILAPQILLTLCVAFIIYGITTIAWIWVLQKISLTLVYPLMALTYVLILLGSYWFFDERFQTHYFWGIALILSGILIAMRAKA